MEILHVGLGHAQQQSQKEQTIGGRWGGGPARERRRARREASRQAATADAAETAATAANTEKEKLAAEHATETFDESDISEEVTEEFQIPQIDGNADGEAHYELKIETHDDCTHNEIVEVMEANFFWTIDDKKIEDSDYLKSLIIQNLEKESLLENEKRKVVNYRIAV